MRVKPHDGSRVRSILTRQTFRDETGDKNGDEISLGGACDIGFVLVDSG